MQRTATIRRYHVWGTARYELRVEYRGECLRHWKDGAEIWAIVQDCPGSGDIEACKDHARKRGFTRVKFAGDWDRRTMPKGGKL